MEGSDQIMTSPESTDGGLDNQDDTVMGDIDVDPNLALRKNTTTNAISSICAAPLETVPPVWNTATTSNVKHLSLLSL